MPNAWQRATGFNHCPREPEAIWWKCKKPVCLQGGQKQLEDNDKDPDVMPKVNEADMAGMMEAIKEYVK